MHTDREHWPKPYNPFCSYRNSMFLVRSCPSALIVVFDMGVKDPLLFQKSVMAPLGFYCFVGLLPDFTCSGCSLKAG